MYRGKIEMLNLLFFTTENNMVLSSLKQELERFGRYTRNCCTTKQATLKDLKCTENELKLTYILWTKLQLRNEHSG